MYPGPVSELWKRSKTVVWDEFDVFGGEKWEWNRQRDQLVSRAAYGLTAVLVGTVIVKHREILGSDALSSMYESMVNLKVF